MNRILNFEVVFKVIGLILMILSAFLLSTIGVALIYNESILPFLSIALFSFLTGGFLFLIAQRSKTKYDLTKKDAYFTVTLAWVLITIIGALPFYISNSIPFFVDALFESVSGFTTTGASILTDIEILPKSMLFWRSLTHWIGGIGIIVLVIVVLPSFKIGSYNLFTLESSLQDKIQPKTRAVGIRLLIIYIVLTFVLIILLLLGKMNLFDSVCHSFGTIATGGYSTKNTSISLYSPYIQYTIATFMLLSGVNFVIYYYMYKRQFKKVRENEEFWFYVFIVSTLVAILTYAIYTHLDKPLEESFREAYFQLASVITCTGFFTADYLMWAEYAWVIIFFTLFIGGSTGSTSGSIKIARHLVLIKNIKNRIQRIKSPNAVIPIRLNGSIIETNPNISILNFILLYIFFFVVATIFLVFLGNDVKTSAGGVATCMAGAGPGIGTVGPVANFYHLSDLSKYVLSFMMILGRLEIFTLIMLFNPAFWRN